MVFYVAYRQSPRQWCKTNLGASKPQLFSKKQELTLRSRNYGDANLYNY